MGTVYITLAEFKNTLQQSSTALDEFAEECLETASRDIDAHCGRRFYADTDATARTFVSTSPYRCYIDDCWAVPTAVKTDDGDTGAFATTWATTDYELEPLNNIGPNAQSGWPYTAICAVQGRTFPTISRTGNVQVTAKWGWAEIPSAVKSACRRIAQLHFEARNAPYGIAGTPETGYLRIQDDRIASNLLEQFVRRPILIG